MIARFVIGFLLLVASLSSFGLTQDSLPVIENLGRYSEFQALEEGDIFSTVVLVCNDRSILLSVLETMQNQPDAEPLLSDELQTEVQTSCWTNPQAELSFIALDAATQQLRQALETPGFSQVSDIRIVEAEARALSLNSIHTIDGKTLALAGSFEELTQEAYFLVLESINISKQ